MANFKKFRKAFQKHFATMTGGLLYLTDVNPYDMWDKYLASFPEGSDPLYKENSEHDCNCCKSFVRNFGNIVAIVDGELVSIWDVPDADHPYKEVCEEMSKFVKTSVKDVFFCDESSAGQEKTLQMLEDGDVKTWDHFHLTIPANYVVRTSIATKKGTLRSNRDVFFRSIKEISLAAAETVIEITDQGSLYRGEDYKAQVKEFIKLKKQYNKLKTDPDIWSWQHCESRFTGIRNTAIGTLLVDITEGVDLDHAVRKFEKVMAPTNYKRPKAIFTKKMVKEAEDKITELGLAGSLGRRFARVDDVHVNDVLFVNRDVAPEMSGSPFDALKTVEKPRNFDKVEEISIEDFITKVLPTAENIRAMVENRHESNFMSVIAPEDSDANPLFSWGNNFAWAYNGDITDSMKEHVKAAGGKVDGVLRYSIQWNDEGKTNSDYDAHCKEPDGNHIYFSNMRNARSKGNLDVDIVDPNNAVAVENITWPDRKTLADGEYKFWVHNYSKRGSGGFSAEIEYDGQTYSFSYPSDLRQGENVEVATARLSDNGLVFKKSLSHTQQSKTVWGVDTGKFVDVSTMMLSPNHWHGKSIGNKHYFFILKDCLNEDNPRGFFNEFLGSELVPHKRVFEALGGQMRVADSDEQLSGIGFSSTKRNDLVVEVEGRTKRTLKIKF